MLMKLDHPLKRLSFILFLGCSLAFATFALLPSPIKYNVYDEWKDSVDSESKDRLITRIDTACAAEKLGGIKAFARDFQIIDAQVSENIFSLLITSDIIEKGEALNISSNVDLTDKEKASFLLLLLKPNVACLKGLCVEHLNSSIFSSILASCSSSIGQRHHLKHDSKWLIFANIEESTPWSLIALAASFVFLFTSLLYGKITGPVVKWIRTGLW